MKDKDTLSRRLALLANGLCLMYLIVMACICCKPELWVAIAGDVGFFVALMLYRVWQARRPERVEAQKTLSNIRQESRLFSFASKGWQLGMLALLASVCLYLCVDLAAFLFAASGQLTVANVIYRRIAPPVVTGLHPAFSLELLASACIEGEQFSSAEQLEQTLLDLRKAVAGNKHELIAAMLANLGDFYVRAGKSAQAEECYRQAVDMSRELHLPQGYGSPLTKPGCLLRDEGRYAEAQGAFTNALAIREAIFGRQSVKVAETLTEFAKLRKREGRLTDAAEMQARAATIEEKTHASANVPADASIVSVVVAAISILLFFGRDRLVLWFVRSFGRRQSAS